MTAPFPALSTPRLHLREVKMEDVAAFADLLSFYVVTRFSDWPDAPSPDQCDGFVRKMTELYGAGNGCAWAIDDATSGAMIGAIRINYILPDWKCGGVGYELHPNAWNKGLATEALGAVVHCAHGRFDLNRLEAWTLPGNGASDRALAKNGFTFEGTQRQRGFFKGAYHDFRIFGRVKADPPGG